MSDYHYLPDFEEWAAEWLTHEKNRQQIVYTIEALEIADSFGLMVIAD